ncbi:MAG TPA: hypothetical protein VHW74_01735 [Mycobacteriales bacterium]|nr:hypothetical protein [Mycobacteriales bacterium]
MDRIPRTRPLAPLNPTPFEATPEYLDSMAATWNEGPSSGKGQQRLAAPIAIMAVVVAIVGACIAVFGHHTDKKLTNADLLKLVRSASASLNAEPSSTYTMTETISAQGHQETLTISGASSLRNHESTLKMTGGGINETAIDIGNVAYLKNPAFSALVPTNKDWLAIRSKPTAIEQQLESSGSAGLLNSLATVKGTVVDEGSDTVGGVDTTKYRFRLNALKLFGSTFSTLFGSSATSVLKHFGFDRMPMTMWLDKQGLPRQIEIDMKIKSVSLTEIEHITPSDTQLSLAAPPASDVHVVGSLDDFGRLLQRLLGKSSPSA